MKYLPLDKSVDTLKDTNFVSQDVKNALISKLQQYLKENNNAELEVKPKTEVEKNIHRHKAIKTSSTIGDELEEVNLTHETKINRQIYNVAENIVFTYFSLPVEKFLAVLDRIRVFGVDLVMEEFIFSYYFIIKNNAYLKQFIIYHLNKIINIINTIIEKQLSEKIGLQDFTSNNDNINNLLDNLAEKEETLLNIKPEKIAINNQNELVNLDKIAQMKLDVLNDLKKNNPELENI